MAMCNNCEEILDKHLCDVPYQWRRALIEVFCAEINKETGCELIKKCETITNLGPFSQVGNTVNITYTDEAGNDQIRTFQIGGLLDQSMNGIDPKCIATPAAWALMSFTDKIEAVLQFKCNCC